MKKLINLFFIFNLSCTASFAADAYFPKNLRLDSTDHASLQRGAKIYFNYCSGCHSLSYERYNRIAQLMGVHDAQNNIYTALVQKYLLFDARAAINQPIITSLNATDAKQWFGIVPPDLTNITLVYSPAWVYNFLRGFYRDDSRKTGANNLIAPNTAMPNVLLPLRGETTAVWLKGQFDHLVTLNAGRLKPLDFDRSMYDLVNFLALVAEPNHSSHQWLGILVIAFLTFLLMIVYFLYRLSQK